VRLILPGELAKHAISEGTKSVTSMYLAFVDVFFVLYLIHLFSIQRVVGDQPIAGAPICSL
jgi:hypothetical protein